MVRGLSRVGTMLHAAHAQDFERKRRPEVSAKDAADDDTDEEEEEEEEARRGGEGEGGEEVEEALGMVGGDEESSVGMVARAESVLGEEEEEISPGEETGR